MLIPPKLRRNSARQTFRIGERFRTESAFRPEVISNNPKIIASAVPESFPNKLLRKEMICVAFKTEKKAAKKTITPTTLIIAKQLSLTASVSSREKEGRGCLLTAGTSVSFR